MQEHQFRFVLEDKEKLVRLLAFTCGWQQAWLSRQRESLENLYGRKADLMDAAVEMIDYRSYPVDDHSCLDHSFLQAFFSRFPQIEILVRPDLTFVDAPVPALMAESYRYEDAWKHHAQVMVLMEPKERIKYLYSYVPESFKKSLKERQEKARVRINEMAKDY